MGPGAGSARRRKADPWSARTSWTGPGGPPARRPAWRRAPEPHALRHRYAASLLIKHGESVETVSERLGHTNAAMTQNIYAPDSEERTRAVVDKVYADREAAVDEAA
ncbi:tyrosine-type recombinase/integrase [Streptomyces shenzhenensis]|uniref:tyrosine-type recombinase/integrase n=1 Tax=Streptomyces shenzhenensis TaxID=943815 RepID=UPI0028680727|nr:tyrosine-type recombinase/integrase [Streptomyces shenzhenensis]